MPRIRSIKPEFQLSQAVGRVSRDARLLFLLVQPQCDDHGKFRGASRMLASLLFPYDDDVPALIEGWLGELEREGCITRYVVDGNEYLRIENWEEYQKVDKPSASKFPNPPETSRAFASPRECSALDQGSRIKDQGREGERAHARARGSASDDDGTMHPLLPEGWSPSVADVEWTRENRSDLGAAALARQLERFRQHVKTRNWRYSDWSAKWRMWLVDAHVDRAGTQSAARPDGDGLPPEDPWDQRLYRYEEGDYWSPMWGSRPENGGSHVPKEKLAAWKQLQQAKRGRRDAVAAAAREAHQGDGNATERLPAAAEGA